jgi:hypothetical protein
VNANDDPLKIRRDFGDFSSIALKRRPVGELIAHQCMGWHHQQAAREAGHGRGFNVNDRQTDRPSVNIAARLKQLLLILPSDEHRERPRVRRIVGEQRRRVVHPRAMAAVVPDAFHCIVGVERSATVARSDVEGAVLIGPSIGQGGGHLVGPVDWQL